MTTRTRGLALVAVVLAVVFALGLCACGGSGGEKFTGYEARDLSSLETIKDAAIELGKQREEAMPSDLSEDSMNSQAQSAFNAANDLYRSEKYGEAAKAYEAILEEYPKHFGANVNLTLAMIHQEQGDAALKQALACAYLFPGSDGVLLNAQVAAADAQFSSEDLESMLSEITWAAGFDKSLETTLSGGSLSESYKYNSLWMRIETDLYGYESMADSEKESAYAAINGELDEIFAAGSTDEDGVALFEYLQAVGKQLGIVE